MMEAHFCSFCCVGVLCFLVGPLVVLLPRHDSCIAPILYAYYCICYSGSRGCGTRHDALCFSGTRLFGMGHARAATCQHGTALVALV